MSLSIARFFLLFAFVSSYTSVFHASSSSSSSPSSERHDFSRGRHVEDEEVKHRSPDPDQAYVKQYYVSNNKRKKKQWWRIRADEVYDRLNPPRALNFLQAKSTIEKQFSLDPRADNTKHNDHRSDKKCDDSNDNSSTLNSHSNDYFLSSTAFLQSNATLNASTIKQDRRKHAHNIRTKRAQQKKHEKQHRLGKTYRGGAIHTHSNINTGIGANTGAASISQMPPYTPTQKQPQTDAQASSQQYSQPQAQKTVSVQTQTQTLTSLSGTPQAASQQQIVEQQLDGQQAYDQHRELETSTSLSSSSPTSTTAPISAPMNAFTYFASQESAFTSSLSSPPMFSSASTASAAATTIDINMFPLLRVPLVATLTLNEYMFSMDGKTRCWAMNHAAVQVSLSYTVPIAGMS